MSEELDTSVIPRGLFCYTAQGEFEDGKMLIKTCPYWSIDESQPEHANGYCKFLKKGDWMEDGTWLVWDQIKACGINEEGNEELRGEEPFIGKESCSHG